MIHACISTSAFVFNLASVNTPASAGASYFIFDILSVEGVNPSTACPFSGDLCYLDAGSVAALQVLSEDEHPAASKAGKESASKEGLSLLALLARTASPMALPVLRCVNQSIQSFISNE